MTPADSLTTRAPANVVPIRRSLAARIPWLWYDYVVSRVPLPLWALSLLLFAVLYGFALLLALIAGEVPQFVRDIRYLFMLLMPAFGSFALGYIPRTMALLWAGIRPWLANTEEQIAALQTTTPDLLSRFFWPCVVIIGTVVVPYTIPGGDPWARDYAHPGIIEKVSLLAAPFLIYFIGALFAIASIGLGLLAHRLSRAADFMRGFILHGGKAALQPFNALLWVVWGTFTLPFILMVVVLIAVDPTSTDELADAVQYLVMVAMVVPTLVVPQLFINRLLAREKAEELRALRAELEEAAAPPQTRDTFEVLQRMQRHQHLLHEIQEMKAFVPTLVDTRFVIQIGTSFTAILLANVALRTILARMLP